MKPRAQLILGLGLAVIGLTALALARLQAWQRVGIPGVRVVAHTVYMEGGQPIGSNSVPLPEHVLDFDSHEQPISKVVVDWLPKDTTYAQRIYQSPDKFWIQANVVLMGTDRTSIHKPEYCLVGQGFTTEKAEHDTLHMELPQPYELPLYKMTVHREVTAPNGAKFNQSALYVFWFVADQQMTADHNERMLWMARDLVTRGVLQRWAYISCFAVCQPGREAEAYARIRGWISAATPQFQLAAAGARVKAEATTPSLSHPRPL